MSVITDLDQSWQEKGEREIIFEARAILENMTNVCGEGLSRLQEMVEGGKLNTVPLDLQRALLRWKNLYGTAKTNFEGDQELIDIYQWRP